MTDGAAATLEPEEGEVGERQEGEGRAIEGDGWGMAEWF